MKHFNKLTPAEAERLALLAEECGELLQCIGKTLRHGYESRHPEGGRTNRESIEKELADVYVAARMMFERNDLRRGACARHEENKTDKVRLYLHHQSAGDVTRQTD